MCMKCQAVEAMQRQCLCSKCGVKIPEEKKVPTVAERVDAYVLEMKRLKKEGFVLLSREDFRVFCAESVMRTWRATMEQFGANRMRLPFEAWTLWNGVLILNADYYHEIDRI